MLDFPVAQDSILVSSAESPNCQLRKLGYKLVDREFNIVKLIKIGFIESRADDIRGCSVFVARLCAAAVVVDA